MMAIRYTLNPHGRITANTDDLRRAVKEMDALMDSTNKRKTGGEVELLPLPKTWRIAQHGADFIEVHTAEQMEAYARANVDRALAESRAEVERVKQWVCHNGGLLNEWGRECPSGTQTTTFVRQKLDAALSLEPNP